MNIGLYFPNHLKIGDLNNDGLDDIIICNDESGQVNWYSNDGEGGFNAEAVLGGNFMPGESDVAIGDADGDGDLDVFYCFSSEPFIYWNENLGFGQFRQSNLITMDSIYGNEIDVGDLNNDNFADIAVGSIETGTLKLFFSLNNGNFNFFNTIEDSISAISDVLISDFDLNNQNDIIYCNAQNSFEQVKIYLNNLYNEPIPFDWLGFIPFQIGLLDFDEDLDSDLIFTDFNDSKVNIFENENNIFQEIFTIESELYNGIRYFDLVDFNSDGYSDVIMSLLNGSEISIVYGLDFDNNQPIIISTTQCCISSIKGVELNQDNKKDIALVSHDGHFLGSINQLNSSFSGVINHFSSTQNIKRFEVADFNADGKDDLWHFSEVDSKVGIFYSENNQTFSTQQILNESDLELEGIAVGKWNAGNDLLDVFLASNDDETIYFLNDVFISSTRMPFIENVSVDGVFCADLNSDGRDELIVDLQGNNPIQIYFNDGFGNIDTIVDIDYSSFISIKELIAKDINSDLITDIVFSYQSSELFNIINNGNYQFSAVNNFAQGNTLPGKLIASDIDLDGDIDFLSFVNNGNQVLVQENLGDGTFNADQVLIDNLNQSKNFTNIDFNNDGLEDLVICGADDQLSVFFNEGSLQFNNSESLNLSNRQLAFLTNGDFDSDGRKDLAMASRSLSTIHWARNFPYQIQASFLGSACNDPESASIIIEIDGNPDFPINLEILGANTALDSTIIINQNNVVIENIANDYYQLTFEDAFSNSITQYINITFNDSVAPIPDLNNLSEITAECSYEPNSFPTAVDACNGIIEAYPDVLFPLETIGQTIVNWYYEDLSGNISSQEQIINIIDDSAPIPVLSNLPDVYNQCQMEFYDKPLAIDNCNDTIFGIANYSFPLDTQANVIVEWTFQDDNANTTVQEQLFIVQDTIAPLPDNATLEPLIRECDITFFDEPLATDNCDGIILGEANIDLPFNELGGHTIIWSFTDAQGNISTQSQSLTIQDTGNPSTFSQFEETIYADCVLWEMPEAPYAADNCDGIIYGVPNIDFPITDAGVTEITWTYTDTTGNESSQTMFVEINPYDCVNSIEEKIQDKINIYPNPVQDFLFIEYNYATTIRQFLIYNANGKLVASITNTQAKIIDVSFLNKGAYFLSIELSDKEFIHKKFIVD